jgi:hypothetical protein
MNTRKEVDSSVSMWTSSLVPLKVSIGAHSQWAEIRVPMLEMRKARSKRLIQGKKRLFTCKIGAI